MINLNFSHLEKPIQIKNMCILSIEDPTVFRKLIEELYVYDEASPIKIFDQAQENLSKTNLKIITDILSYELNSTGILKLIYKDLLEQLNENPEIKNELENLILKIEEILDKELLDHELDLRMEEMTIEKIFKAYGVKIESENREIFSKIFEIIDLYKYLGKKQLLIFVNALSYLNIEEMKSLREYIELNKQNILFIERGKKEGISQYYMDEDYFLFQNML